MTTSIYLEHDPAPAFGQIVGESTRLIPSQSAAGGRMLPLQPHLLVHHKSMDALYGPILVCYDTQQNHRLVAVKLIHKSQRKQLLRATANLDDPEQEQQMIQMLRATPGHANVVQYHDVVDLRAAQMLMFVMEFCAGGDLQQAVNRTPHQRFEEPQALLLFRQIACGVQFLHAHGIAHRDLSLENVVLTDQGVCKVCDFGLSVRSNQKTADRVGTRYCMAPEVVAGQCYNPVQADIWSLGVILFVLLTGSPLFAIAKEGDMTFETLQRQGLRKILQLWQLEQLISPETTVLLSKMLQVNPTARVSAKEILYDRVFDWITIVEALNG